MAKIKDTGELLLILLNPEEYRRVHIVIRNTCSLCGGEYTVKRLKEPGVNRFCSAGCSAYVRVNKARGKLEKIREYQKRSRAEKGYRG